MKKILLFFLTITSTYIIAQERLNGVVQIDIASSTDNNSPGITVKLNDDFLYDGKYLNHYGFGFHDFQDVSSSLNGRNAYVSGYFGIDFFTGGNNRLRLNYNGNIGIGTLAPQAKLDVNGNIIALSTAANTYVKCAKKGAPGVSQLFCNSSGGGLELFDKSGARLVMLRGYDSSSGGYIKNALKIGDVSNPTEVLDVNGIGLSNKGFKASFTGTHSSNIWTNQGGSGVDVFDGTNQVVRFGTYGVNFVSGSLSIGKNTTPSAKLDVAGNIKAHEIEVTLAAMQDLQLNGTLAANNITYTANGNTADFVFEDNYHLKDLSEVEAFIKANKHLPEIPSAAEMENAGVNLAEMNKLLLMKVEELTLYAIEQKVVAEKNEAEVERLKAEVDEVRSSESAVRKEMEEKVESLELKVEELSDEKRAMRGEMEERLAKMESLLEKLTLNL